MTTLTLLAPVTVFGSIVIDAVRAVMLVTETELTVIPTPNSTLVTPVIKLVPTMETSSVSPLPPALGLTPLIVGAGLPIVKAPASVAVPPPGAALVTVAFLTPTPAPVEIVTFTVK